MNATTARAIGDLAALEPSWRSLRSIHGAATPNSDPRRYAATLEALGPEVRPQVTLIDDGGTPRAIIIGRRSTRALGCRLYRFTARVPRLRCLDIVYGGIVTDGTPEAIAAVCGHLDSMLAGGEVEHVMINHLPVRHELFRPLADHHAITTIDCRGRADRHWRFALVPGSFEQTTSGFTGKHRYNIRRADRLLVEHFQGAVTLHRVTASDEVGAFVDTAARITAAGYQGAIGAGLTGSASHRRILARAAEDGGLRGYLLECGGAAIAYQAALVCDNVYHLQATGYLPDHAALSPGQVLLTRVIRDLCQAGLDAIDYGFGDARYKQVYGTDCWDEATVYLYGRTLGGSCARLVHRAAGAATRLADRSGLARRLKKGW